MQREKRSRCSAIQGWHMFRYGQWKYPRGSSLSVRSCVARIFKNMAVASVEHHPPGQISHEERLLLVTNRRQIHAYGNLTCDCIYAARVEHSRPRCPIRRLTYSLQKSGAGDEAPSVWKQRIASIQCYRLRWD